MHYASTLTLALTLFSSISGVTVKDPGFESFEKYVEANDRFTGFSVNYIALNAYHKESQGNPWTYKGRFNIAKSGYWYNWIMAPEGSFYASLMGNPLGNSSFEQTITELTLNKEYTVSWSQRAKRGYGGNDIHVSIDGVEVYGEANIWDNGYWEIKRSIAFTAASDTAVLKIESTMPDSGIALFIDNVNLQPVASENSELSIQDLGFESYLAAISNNDKTDGRWLGHAEAAQEPWTYTGGFRPAKTGNAPYGSVESVDGEVYAVLLNQASISQSLSGLVEGTDYVVSWFQRGRPNDDKAGNDINLSIGDLPIYTQDGIYDEGDWEAKSVVFTATSETAMLKIWTTNPNGGHRSVFIDAISFNRALIQDPGFESYLAAIHDNEETDGRWLGFKQAAQEPWSYTGGFRAAISGNKPWGKHVKSVDGGVYAILLNRASIEQTITGLISGSEYSITWSQQGRPGIDKDGNDINLSIEGSTIYAQTGITKGENGKWSVVSTTFIATSGSAVLKIWTTNPLGGRRSLFIDDISVKKVY